MGGIDDRAALGVLANGRAADAYALATGAALVHDGSRIARAIDERQGLWKTSTVRSSRIVACLERGLDRLVILGIDATDVIDAERAAQRLDVESLGLSRRRGDSRHALARAR